MSLTISTEGDIGDICYLACLLKHLPDGPHSLLFRQSTLTKANTPERAATMFNLLKLLLDQQDYIKEFRMIEPGEQVDWKSEDFRALRHYTPGETLMQAHLNHFCVVRKTSLQIKGDAPWLKVTPSPLSKGRVIVNRTGRYRNDQFPWAKVVDHYRHTLLFVGLHHEWRETCGLFGYMDFAPTNNLLEVAQLIAGSELFIGNQSCAFALAEGLKHPRIQETSLTFPDCIFPTAEGFAPCQPIADGEVHLPAVGTRPSTVIPSNAPVFKAMDIMRVPPGSWQYPNMRSNPSIHALAIEVSKMNGVSIPQAKEMIYEFNCNRLPDFFRAETPHLDRFNKALKKVS